MTEFPTKLPLGENELTVEPGTQLLIQRLVYKCPWCNFTHIGHSGFSVTATDDYVCSPKGHLIRRFDLQDNTSVCHCGTAAIWISTNPPMPYSKLEELDRAEQIESAPLCA